MENTEQKQEEFEAVLGKELISVALLHLEAKRTAEAISEGSIVKTGFNNLDTLLMGGVYPGLYVVGAISSLGKTTFVLQLAETFAKQGKQVLFVSLEMSRLEIVSKMISRHTFLNADKWNLAKATYKVLNGRFEKDFTEEEKDLITRSEEELSEINTLYIQEGVGDIGTSEIRKKAIGIRETKGEAPIIIIDYLQILSPYNERLSDKQNVDRNIVELKRLSRDLNTPVIAISSFNRDSYTDPINLTAFKESGSIEYSSDVLIGLQYDGMDYKEGEKDGDRIKRIRELIKDQDSKYGTPDPRRVELKVLKNRNGKKGTALFDFYPTFNHFAESEDPEEDEFIIY